LEKHLKLHCWIAVSHLPRKAFKVELLQNLGKQHFRRIWKQPVFVQ
jgi:hypothetical protein